MLQGVQASFDFKNKVHKAQKVFFSEVHQNPEIRKTRNQEILPTFAKIYQNLPHTEIKKPEIPEERGPKTEFRDFQFFMKM